MRVAFAGTPAPAAVVLRHLAAGPYAPSLVITAPDKPRGRRGTPSPSPVAEAAEDLGLPCVRTANINAPEVRAQLHDLDIGALCVVAFGQILRDEVLASWPCLNVHYSILPAYRGAAPVERALMDGVTETGVTIMQMDAGLDTGPIVSITTTPVTPDDDAGSVFARLGDIAGPALTAALDQVAAGTFAPTPQPAAGVSHAAKITTEDRRITPDLPAAQVANTIRALSPHIGAKCTIDGEPFTLWQARTVDASVPRGLSDDGGRLLMGCRDGAVEILTLQPPGKGRMAAGDFLRGWRGALEMSA